MLVVIMSNIGVWVSSLLCHDNHNRTPHVTPPPQTVTTLRHALFWVSVVIAGHYIDDEYQFLVYLVWDSWGTFPCLCRHED